MKALKRLTALLLVLTLAVCGLPVSAPVLAAEDEDLYSAGEGTEVSLPENEDPPVPQTPMRFIQKTEYDSQGNVIDDGFDESTGILTMVLEVKPTPGVNGEYVAEGMFLFQTDISSVVPVARNLRNEAGRPQWLLPVGDKAAFAGSSALPAIQEYLNSGKAYQAATSFITDCGGSTKLSDRLTALVVAKSKTEENTLDCYFQFSYETNTAPAVDSEGYLQVAELDFQCYAGYNEDGTQKPAENLDFLYSESIRVPRKTVWVQDPAYPDDPTKKIEQVDAAQTAAAVQAIVDTFNDYTYETVEGAEVPLVMGGAGFIQAYKKPGYTEGEAYYYYNQPKLSKWRKGATPTRQVWCKDASPEALEDAPGLWYRHINDRYNLQGFNIFSDNTFSTDTVWEEDPAHPGSMIEKPVTEYDFKVPDDVVGEDPRYTVPVKTRADQNALSGEWVPSAYLGQNPNNPTYLKYRIDVNVSENSVSSPVDPQEGGLQGILDNTRWEIRVNKISLETYAVAERTKALLSRQFGMAEDQITEDMTLEGDLGADELGLQALFSAAAELFGGTALTSEKQAEIQTVGDLIHALEVCSVESRVKAILSAQFGRSESGITAEMTLAGDLGATSAGLQEMYSTLSTSMNVKPTAQEKENIRTVGDLINCAEEHARAEVEETEESQIIDTATQSYRVKEAFLRGEGTGPLKDCKVWTVYKVESADDPGTYFMTAPRGVILEWKETQVTAYNRFAEKEEDREIEETCMAPQLHVTNEAADLDNCIWFAPTSGQISLLVTYTNGTSFANNPINVRLYKDAAKAARADLQLENIPEIQWPEGKTDKGFFVGKPALDGTGEDTWADQISETGISVKSTLYDQYDLPMHDKWNVLTLTPVGDKAQLEAMEAEGKSSNPFKVEQVKRPTGAGNGEMELTNEYTIKYNTRVSPNYVKPGKYLLKAVGDGIKEEKELYVNKSPDRLSYLSVGRALQGQVLSTRAVEEDGVVGEEITVQYDVPTRTAKGADDWKNESLTIEDLSNQWRDPDDTPLDRSDYDLLPGLRTSGDLPMNLSQLLRGVSGSDDKSLKVTIEKTEPTNPVAIDTSRLRRDGTFRFSNYTEEKDTFSCKVTATYGDDARFVRYIFKFKRQDPSENELNSVLIREPEEASGITIKVPLPGEPAVEQLLTVDPINQYGDVWNWDSVWKAYQPGGSQNQDNETYDHYRVHIVDGESGTVNGTEYENIKPKGASGVTLTGEDTYGKNFAKVRVEAGVKDCRFQVVATAPNKTSNKVWVNVQRESSQPKSVEKPVYNSSGANIIKVPAATGTALTVKPDWGKWSEDGTRVIYYGAMDQYDDWMTSVGRITWRYTITATDPPVEGTEAKKPTDYISVNGTTGEITVKPCAPACEITLRVQVERGGVKRSSDPVTVQIQRNRVLPVSTDPSADPLTVDNTPIDYPDRREAATFLKKLTASCLSQYNDRVTLTSGVTWTLDSAIFPDGEERQINSDNDSYNARESVYLNKDGTLSFRGGVPANNVPRSITVTANYSGGYLGKATIPINKKTSVAETIYLESSHYKDGIQIPPYQANGELGYSEPLTLEAYVRDQYNLVMEDEKPVWSTAEELPSYVHVDYARGTVTVDSSAPTSGYSIPFVITYNGEDTEGNPINLTETQYVSVYQGTQPIPSFITITGVNDSKGIAVPGNTLDLPERLADGTAQLVNYTMTWNVLDQNRNRLTSPVEWRVAGTSTGISAEVTETNKNSGIVTLQFTPEALADLKQNTTGTITMEAKIPAEDNPSALPVTETLQVKLADRRPVYAVPTFDIRNVNSTHEDEENGVKVERPLVPDIGNPATTIPVDAMVYDQYGEPMPQEPVSWIYNVLAGVSYQTVSTAGPGSSDPNRCVISVTSSITGSDISITAVPKGKEEEKPFPSQSGLPIRLSKGAAVPTELWLDTKNTENTETIQRDPFELPLWGRDRKANTPDAPDPAPGTEQLDLAAWVHSQYGAWMESVSATVHPIWNFRDEEDHDGVQFAGGGTEPPTTVEGEEITLDIEHDAIPYELVSKGILTRKVWLKVTTSGPGMTGPSFTKEFAVNLKRDPGTATYLYITDATASGVAEEPIMRPYAKNAETGDTGVVEYQFSPVVYDQYGIPMDDQEIDIDLESISPKNNAQVELEKIFKRGQSEEKGDRPIAYNIYRLVSTGLNPDGTEKEPEKILMAEFSRETGIFKVYTECTELSSILLKASCDAVDEGGTKTLRIPIQEEPIRPYWAHIKRAQGPYFVTSSMEMMTEDVSCEVYDQYGEIYPNPLRFTWDLRLPDQDGDGELDPYTEVDKDGNPQAPGNYLVQLDKSAGDETAQLLILPESYYENKTVVLQCRVSWSDTGGAKQLFGYSNVEVRRRSSGGGGVVVTFNAGEYGKLVGASEYTINAGEVVPNPPGVKTVEGYGFMGWTVDGTEIVDASKNLLFGDTAYAAVYKDVTNTKFLEGYKGGTVRPQINVTRAEFITMVTRALGGYDPAKDYGESFGDVKKDAWYANYIAFAKQKGVAAGYPDGTYRPEQPITRAEASKLLAEAAKIIEGGTGTFKDVPEGAWFAKYIEALSQAGVVNGYGDGTYRPGRNISRAEAVKLIIQATKNSLNEFERNNIQDYAYCPFTDIRRGHWAYAYILRAAGIA